MLPNRGHQRQIEYHDLLNQIRQIENEINVLSHVDNPGGQAGARDFDRSMQNFRAELASTAVVTKRQELEALKARASEMLARDPKVAEPLPPPKPPSLPTKRSPKLIVGLIALVVVIGVVLAVGYRMANRELVVSITLLAPTLEFRNEVMGEQFFTKDSFIQYDGGTVTLSGDPAPHGEWSIDDRMVMTVTHPDKSVATWEHLFNEDCVRNQPLGPQEVTSLFAPGANTVTVTLFDACGGAEGTSGPILLTVH